MPSPSKRSLLEDRTAKQTDCIQARAGVAIAGGFDVARQLHIAAQLGVAGFAQERSLHQPA